jgi:hypothetical protein
VAAFIPIVGTYISATVPIIVTFITVGSKGALALLIYVLIYQQVENYLISPKIQGRTMQLHPAVAFGAALAGGAIRGPLVGVPRPAVRRDGAGVRIALVPSPPGRGEPADVRRAPAADADAGRKPLFR